MDRPEIPTWWRAALGAIALLQVPFVLAEVVPWLAQNALSQEAWFLGNAIAGGALGIAMLRRGGRDRIAAFAGLAGAIGFAIASEVVFFALAWLGPCMALALACARPHVAATPLAALGVVGTLLVMRASLHSRGPVQPEWHGALALMSGVALILGIALLALVGRSIPSAPLTRRARIGLALGGTTLLALSWLLGGNLLFLPLWPLAIALLVVPPLAAWRTAAAGAALVGAVALAGLVPIGTCTYDPWSDAEIPGRAADADARPELATLGEAGVHGPSWSSGDGFGGYAVACPGHVVALGGAWDVALVAAAIFAAVRRGGGDAAAGGVPARA